MTSERWWLENLPLRCARLCIHHLRSWSRAIFERHCPPCNKNIWGEMEWQKRNQNIQEWNTNSMEKDNSIRVCVAANLDFNRFRLILLKKWTKDLPLSRFEIVKYKSGAFWAPASWCLAVTFRISPAVTFTFSSHTLLQVICTTIAPRPALKLQDDRIQCSWTIKTMARPRAQAYS